MGMLRDRWQFLAPWLPRAGMILSYVVTVAGFVGWNLKDATHPSLVILGFVFLILALYPWRWPSPVKVEPRLMPMKRTAALGICNTTGFDLVLSADVKVLSVSSQEHKMPRGIFSPKWVADRCSVGPRMSACLEIARIQHRGDVPVSYDLFVVREGGDDYGEIHWEMKGDPPVLIFELRVSASGPWWMRFRDLERRFFLSSNQHGEPSLRPCARFNPPTTPQHPKSN